MSPLSWPVVVGTLVVGSPALYAAQVAGTLSPDVALVRLLVCMGVVWLGLSVLASLTEGAVASNKLANAADEAAARKLAATSAMSDETTVIPAITDDLIAGGIDGLGGTGAA